MSINQRSKGSRQERKLAKMFSEWWGSEFTRTPLSGGFATKSFREDWNAAGDLVTPDESFPFCVESKNVEGWHLEQLLTAPKCLWYSWWAQTTEETPDKQVPLLVFTRNRQPEFYSLIPNEKYPPIPGTAMFLMHEELGMIMIGLMSDLLKTNPDDWKND